MKKLTLVLVALLLALACVFAACGKKNDTPTDTDPKPVDTDPAPVVNPTVAKEDLVKIAEALNESFAKSYVDLYSAEVKEAIDTAKSNALAQIYAASTKEEAQDIANKFIEFLTAQKTTVAELKALIEKIGDVALADEDAVNEAEAYKAALDKAFAGNNAAKKAVLDAYKADEELQDTVDALVKRLAALKDAKDDANVKIGAALKTKDEKVVAAFDKKNNATDAPGADGKVDVKNVNVQIAELKEAFDDLDQEDFNLKQANAYKDVVALAKLIADAYEIEVGSDAYNEIFDVATLAAAKATLDAAIAADPVLVVMQNVVDAAEALKVAAEEARYVETIVADKNKVGDESATNVIPVKVEEKGEIVIKYAPAKPAEDAEKENLKTYEIAVSVRDLGEATNIELYNLSFYKDVNAAEKVSDSLTKKYSAAKLANYGYGKPGDLVKAAVDGIEAIGTAYTNSVKVAEKLLNKDIYKAIYTDVELKKDATIGTYSAFTTTPKKYKTDLEDEITTVVNSMKKVNAAGYEVSNPGAYLDEGDYKLGAKSFYLISGAPAIKYTAFTYSWYLEKAGDLAGSKEFDLLDALTGANKDDGKYFVDWLKIFFGEADYGEKIDLNEFKDEGTKAFKDKVIYMTDRAVTEAAAAEVTKIKGAAVTDKATDALEAKVLSPYTIAQKMIAEAKEIADAKTAALKELADAALALREAGDADAIDAIDTFYTELGNGKYLNKQFNGDDADKEYDALYAADVASLEVVVKTVKKVETPRKVSAIITDAKNAKAAAEALVDLSSLSDAALKAEKDALEANKANIKFYEDFIKAANAELTKVTDGNGTTSADDTALHTKGEVTAATKDLAIVNAFKDLMTSGKAAFDAAEDAFYSLYKANILVGAKDAKEICSLIGKFSATKVSDYDDLGKNTDPEKKAQEDKEQAFYDDLAALYAGTKDAQTDILKAIKNEEEKLAQKFDEFEIAVKASAVNATNVTTALTAIDTFANNNNADYVNLTISKTFGEKTITIDLFTEAYRQNIMANAYAVIGNVLEYAVEKKAALETAMVGTDGDKDDPTTWKADSWAGIAKANLDEEIFAIDALASVKVAKETVKGYVVADGIYDFDEAARLINEKVDPDIDADVLKVNVGIK